MQVQLHHFKDNIMNIIQAFKRKINPFDNTFKVTGKLLIEHFNEKNELIDTRKIKNLVVTSGRALIANRLGPSALAAIGWMAVGTSSTAPSAAQTNVTAIAGTKVALDSTTIVTTTVTNDSVRYIATFGPGVSTAALVEAGLFNNAALATGDMLARTTFSVINKAAGDTVILTWTVTIA